MTNDKDLENLFSTAVTSFDDNAEFTTALSDSLARIEQVKCFYEKRRRNYVANIVLAFLAGAVSAVLFVLAYPHLPVDAEVLGFLLHPGKLFLLSGQAKVISGFLFVVTSTSVLFGAFSAFRSLVRPNTFI